MNLKVNNENELNNLLSCNNKLNKFEMIYEILKYKVYDEFDIDIYNINDHEFIFYNFNEYDIDELFNDLMIKYEIIKIDDELNDIIIKIDDDEFEYKDIIESYDDLLKYYHEYYDLDELTYDLIEFDDKFNYVGMNHYMDYKMKCNYLLSNYHKFKLNPIKLNDDLLIKFKKIFDDEFIDDIELIYDLDELYDDYIESYKNYDIELNYDEYIIINHRLKTIRNIYDDELYELIGMTINKYLFINDNKNILYDEIIELINIISLKGLYNHNFQIINYDNELIKLNIHDDEYDIDELIDIFKHDYDDDEFDIDEFENKYKVFIDPINYDDLDDLFDIDIIIEFIDDHVEINYNYYNYNNYIKLNELFYRILNKYHKI